MCLEFTLRLGIASVLKRQPDATPTQVCAALRTLRWSIDDEEVVAHLEGRCSDEPVAAAVVGLSSAHRRSARPQPGAGRVDEIGLPASLATSWAQLQTSPAPVCPAANPSRTEEWSKATEEINAALSAEIGANLEKSPERRVQLRSGTLIAATPRGLTARWETDSEAITTEGSKVKVFLTDRDHDAEVLEIDGLSIVLFVHGSRATTVPDATLVLDASYLLDLRRQFMQRLQEDQSFDRTAALSFRREPQHPHLVDWSSAGSLNVEQERFVRLALAGGVSWLWGPPGTGKTTTLAFLLRELLLQGQRTLFVSNTNAAVDTALLRLLDVGGEPTKSGDVVRVGPPSGTRR